LLLKTPISDPDIDAFAKGKINFANVTKFMPLEKGTQLTGTLASDIMLKGRLSAIEKQQYEQFSASGSLSITGMNYLAPPSAPIVIRTFEMSFDPRQVALNNFDAKVGRSDFRAKGSLNNFLAYALKGDVLKGNLVINSSLIDLNEFMTGSATGVAKTDTASMQVIDVPGNVDFTMTAAVDRLLYQNLEIQHAAGVLLIQAKAIRMKDVVMQLMDGSVKMNGAYSTKDIKKPMVDFDMAITDFNIPKTAAAFASIGKMAPIAKYTQGKFSSQLNFSSVLNAKMEPVLESAGGYGKLTTSAVSVTNFTPVTKIADALKIASLKNLTVPPTNLSFKITGGRIFVDPFDVSVNGMKATVAGSNGLDQTLDYGATMNIPRSVFGSAANSALNGLISQANASGANFSVSDNIPVEIGVKGMVTDPKISVNISKAGASLMKDMKAKAEAEIAARAKAEADKLKKEAEDKLNTEKDKAKAEADRLKKEAENKAKAYSDSLKREAQKKAKEQLDQINPFKKK
jgi:hypothetical protein